MREAGLGQRQRKHWDALAPDTSADPAGSSEAGMSSKKAWALGLRPPPCRLVIVCRLPLGRGTALKLAAPFIRVQCLGEDWAVSSQQASSPPWGWSAWALKGDGAGPHSIHCGPPRLRALHNQVFTEMHAVSPAPAPMCCCESQPSAKFPSSDSGHQLGHNSHLFIPLLVQSSSARDHLITRYYHCSC